MSRIACVHLKSQSVSWLWTRCLRQRYFCSMSHATNRLWHTKMAIFHLAIFSQDFDSSVMNDLQMKLRFIEHFPCNYGIINSNRLITTSTIFPHNWHLSKNKRSKALFINCDLIWFQHISIHFAWNGKLLVWCGLFCHCELIHSLAAFFDRTF